MTASPIRPKRGTLVHATTDYRTTLCGKDADGWLLRADEVPTCKRCLRKLVEL